MMKMAFYRGMGEGGTWKNKAAHRAIAIVSSPHTHVELVFSDGLSFSSEFGIGPRIKNIFYSHRDRWTIIDLPFITAEMEARIRRRAELLAALCRAGLIKYDTRGGIGCLWTGIDRAWKYFCSEVVYDVIAPEIAIPRLNFKMHPQKLLQIMAIVNEVNRLDERT